MRNVFLTLILLSLCTLGMGQINLREGIVITLQGDTLHGDIDYRTDEMNAKNCLFRQNGTSDFTNFQPGEIKAYRFLENGRYYVSKHTPDGKLLFLEYVVRGQLNLYYVGSTFKSNTFYLENESGELIEFKQLERNSSNKDRRKNLYKALAMTNQSESTQKILWNNDITRPVAIEAIINYNHEVCPDGECEILEYKSKKLPKKDRSTHFTLMTGMSLYKPKVETGNFDKAYNTGINLSLGVDYYLPRFLPGFFGEVYATYCHVDASAKIHPYIGATLIEGKDDKGNPIPVITYYSPNTIDCKASWNDIGVKAGVGYQYMKKAIQPRIHAGYVFTNTWAKYKAKEGDYTDKVQDVFRLGFYGGAGISFPVKHGAWLLDCTNLISVRHGASIHQFSCSVGYQF